MRALALRQPWAELVVSGKKTIEVRGTDTSYRGWFAVYATKHGARDSTMKRFGLTDLPTGVIIGKAFLADVKQYRDEGDFFRDSTRHLATKDLLQIEGWKRKRLYGYVLSEAKRIAPIPYRGMPGFFPVPEL